MVDKLPLLRCMLRRLLLNGCWRELDTFLRTCAAAAQLLPPHHAAAMQGWAGSACRTAQGNVRFCTLSPPLIHSHACANIARYTRDLNNSSKRQKAVIQIPA